MYVHIHARIIHVHGLIRKLNALLHECTVNREIFVLNNFHAIIFRVKIFSYESRPYENILTTKIFLQQKFRVQHYTYSSGQ